MNYLRVGFWASDVILTFGERTNYKRFDSETASFFFLFTSGNG
jgi:hypothetical protein